MVRIGAPLAIGRCRRGVARATRVQVRTRVGPDVAGPVKLAVAEGVELAHVPARAAALGHSEQHEMGTKLLLVDGRAVAERGVGVAGGGRATRAARAGPRGAVRLHAREDPAQVSVTAAAERVAVGVQRLRATTTGPTRVSFP